MTKKLDSRFLIVSMLLLVLVAAACGQPNKVGTEKLLDIDEAGLPECRLGEKCESPSPAPTEGEGQKGAITNPQPTEAAPSPPPPQEQFFEVTLVENSPYFEPGNALTMGRNLTLRVTNRDNCTCRPWRTFTADDGSFTSPRLAPGQSWTTKLSPGFWNIVDDSAGFIRATLEVV